MTWHHILVPFFLNIPYSQIPTQGSALTSDSKLTPVVRVVHYMQSSTKPRLEHQIQTFTGFQCHRFEQQSKFFFSSWGDL